MPTESNASPVVLSIAGFDPSGGAGLIADVRTLVAFGCRPVAAMTSLTFQNSERFAGAIHQSAESLRAQILPVVKEFHIAAVKIGMLPTREVVLEVARLLSETTMPAPVIDPVLRSSSDYELMEPEARKVWLTELMPLARLITPNIPEAEVLTGMSIGNESDMRTAASKLRETGARAVLIKGGHLAEAWASCPPAGEPEEAGRMPALPADAIDLLDDDGAVTVFRGEWIDAPPVRGTGCMLSAAIAAGLAHGMNLPESVGAAKRFVADAIRYAKPGQ
ncbi:MAG: hydroxymethylpyrimidine/phosphomethylpyrimidine kinase [Blastocatellia bacterium]|jgi:hydroxymethylpyrimidine kinase/phosphomethylpyrimidine kinase|nr:hydroxymethylpyrimidine/phosphomethylpyrimidine kinase [Blastocatellia bacterium]